jgi:GT2 family glycosyltransferase
MFSIIIPTLGLKRKSNKRYFYKKRYDLIDCLTSLKNNYDTTDVQIIIIFNGCDEKEIKYVLDKFPFVNFSVNRENVGVARSWNIGSNLSKYENIIFLNDDCIIKSSIFIKYHEYLNENKDVGIIGPEGSFWKNLRHESYYEAKNIGSSDAIAGFCFMTRNKTLARLGYFDVAYTPAGYEEIDFCFASKLSGFKNIVWPCDKIIHNIVHGVSGTKQDITFFDQTISTEVLNNRNKQIFFEKWKNENINSLL